MNSVRKLPGRFTHIYVEKDILHQNETERICAFFPDAVIVPVNRYTDIFDRRRQSPFRQHQYQNLILAEKRDHFLYPGSPVCQDFSYDYFYYCAPVMNCIYDCEYCWLKGMYPSGYLVVFVNQEDYFQRCREMLEKHPVYLCISFDADLLSLEPILGYVRKWTEFAMNQPDLTIEIRTKAASFQSWNDIPLNERVIFAFTLSPDEVIEKYEHGTPSLNQRLKAVKASVNMGRMVRLCIDPMIPLPHWKKAYHEMMIKIAEMTDLNRMKDISVGTFRISADYLKRMRAAYPSSAIIQYPYVNENGFYHLPFGLNEEMEKFMIGELCHYTTREKIFTWEENDG